MLVIDGMGLYRFKDYFRQSFCVADTIIVEYNYTKLEVKNVLHERMASLSEAV